jgi:site-specific DNA-methyltransferase (adenine-specific)
MRPYYQDDAVTIYHGDCREVLPTLAGHSIITDPPYNMNSVERFYGDSKRQFKPGGANDAPVDTAALSSVFATVVSDNVAIWCSGEQLSGWLLSLEANGLSVRHGAWVKTNPSPMNGEHQFLSGIELCAIGRKPKAFFGGFCEVPAWKGKSQPRDDHPTAKPAWLMSRIVERLTPPAATILDPFMGSGTTLRAAKDLGRKAIGIEIEERYCEVAAKRMAQECLAFP